MATRIAVRRDTAANWATANPVLVDGEPALEKDTGLLRYGNGIDHYLDLDYINISVDALTKQLPNAVRSVQAANLGDVAQIEGAAVAASVQRGAFTSDYAYATLDDALAATPVGGVLEIKQAWTKTVPLSVAKSCTIRFKGGSITMSTDTAALDISANNVTIESPNLIGPGGDTAGTAAGIRAVSIVGAPITGLRIRGGTVDGFRKHGIYLEQVTDFMITDSLIKNIAYGAIMVLSGLIGIIRHNTVNNVIQPTGFVNSYGIAMTRASNQDIATAPRSSGVIVDGNRIDGVTNWEGIDTHGGENLTIVNNVLRNVFIGIALVPCPNEAGDDTYAPRGIQVMGNFLSSGKTDGTSRAGIQLVGCIGATVDTVVEYASAIITGNTVEDFGVENTSAQAAVFLQVTRGAVVANNRIVRPSPNGINCYHNNVGTVITGNAISDVWTNSGTAAGAIYVSSVHQSLVVVGNRGLRGDKTATVVNDRGLYLASALAQPDVTIQYGDNHFKDFTFPIIDQAGSQNISEQRMEARRLSFYPGITPVVRPTVTGSRGSNAALTSLLTALASQGLIVNSSTT
jgi:hypothetical protein